MTLDRASRDDGEAQCIDWNTILVLYRRGFAPNLNFENKTQETIQLATTKEVHMNTFTRVLHAFCITFSVAIFVGCGRHSEPASEIRHLSSKELPSTLVKKEKAKHYDEDGVLLSEITFTWEMPKGYRPRAVPRIDVSTPWRDGSATGRVCNLQEVNAIGSVFGGSTYECTVYMHAGREVTLDFTIIESKTADTSGSILDFLDPATWPEGVMPKGSTRFGAIKISKGNDWYSDCSATVSTKPTDCIVENVGAGLGWWIKIESLP